MTRSPLPLGFDGLLNLSRREGVDVRPTLLRVLSDLYVQTASHSSDEARQFVELCSRLIDEVDEATRALVRARLSVYPGTPAEILRKLGLPPANPDPPVPFVDQTPFSTPMSASAAALTQTQPPAAHNLSMQAKDAAEIYEMFFRARSSERVAILHNLAETPLKAAPRIPEPRARRAIETLEMAAFAGDIESFTIEVDESLILPARVAAQIVDDPSGEPLAAAMRALSMPPAVFQRVLLFLKPEFGTSVHIVYRLSRLYDRLSERSALVMLAVWRGATLASARAKFRPSLYDDERQRARMSATTPRSRVQPGSGLPVRTGTDAS